MSTCDFLLSAILSRSHAVRLDLTNTTIIFGKSRIMEALYQEYTTILSTYMQNPDKEHLSDTHAFGKRCSARKLSIAEIINMHFLGLESLRVELTNSDLTNSRKLLLEVILSMSTSDNSTAIANVLATLYEDRVRQYKELRAAKDQLEEHSSSLEKKVGNKAHTLTLAEENYEFIIQNIPEIIYKIDPEGRFVYLNHVVRSLGYEPEELLGKHFSILILPKDAVRVSSSKVLPNFTGQKTGHKGAPKLFDERRTGVRMTSELEIRLLLKSSRSNIDQTDPPTKDLVYVEINSSGLYASYQQTKERKFLGTVGIIRDITERRKTEEKLHQHQLYLEEQVAERTAELLDANRSLQDEITERKQSQEFSQDILSAMGQSLVVIGPDHRIITANKAYYELTDQPLDTLIGDKCFSTLYQKGEPCFESDEECPVKQALTSGKRQTVVKHHLDKKGDMASWEMQCYPMRNATGKIVSTMVIITDITAKLKLEKQLQQAQKLESIGTLAGGIAHDFNNILGVIVGYSELASVNFESGIDARDEITQILKASARAEELVQQILTFSRKTETQLQPMQPHLVTNEALKMLRASIPSSVTINTEIDKNCGSIESDPTNIHQIIVNLCTNAFQAMENEKGNLTVTLRRQEIMEKEIAGNTISPGAFIVLTVADTGRGMDKETMQRIFDPFFTTKDVDKGTGLGLAVIHGIVQDSKGFIEVESTPGQGSIFRVYFPVLNDDIPLPKKIIEKDVPTGTERILLVDDEPLLVKLEQKQLEMAGFQVTGISNSTDALKKFQSDPDKFDLIVTDQTMPGLRGSELARAILKINPAIPIILCTGFSSVISKEEALAAGIKKFVVKPTKRHELVTAIRTVLDEQEG